MTSVASTVSCARSESVCRRPGPATSPTVLSQPIPGAPQRLDALPRERYVDLAAQVADVDLDDVGIAVEVLVPHVMQQVGLADDLARMPQQVLEHRELPRRQRDLDAAPVAPPSGGVGEEFPRHEPGRPAAGAAPGHCTQPREQYDERERLHQVVVRAEVERVADVVLAVL